MVRGIFEAQQEIIRCRHIPIPIDETKEVYRFSVILCACYVLYVSNHQGIPNPVLNRFIII